MRTNPVLPIIAFLAIIFSIGIFKTQTALASHPVADSEQAKTAAQEFKNIQVLKDIPADQLIPTMQFIAASLGVECDFCHVQGAFDKDDKKPKLRARQMMDMMFAINKDTFHGHRVVTCYSCHRGNMHPVGTPMVASAEMSESTQQESQLVKAPSAPSADSLIDKYVQSLGGAAAIEKVKSFAARGTIEMGPGRSVPIDIYDKDPSMRISYMHMPQGDSITAFNGHEGWLAFPHGPVRDMHGPDIDAASMDADLHFATHLQQMFSSAKVEGTEKVDDHDTYVVIGQREGKTPLTLYFDQQSGLLVRLYRLGETALGQLPTQIDYADYREVNGVKVPYQWTLARPNGRFTIKLNELQQNVPIDDAKFVKPARPQEAERMPDHH